MKMEEKTPIYLDEKNAKYVNDMVTAHRVGSKVAGILIITPFLLIFIVFLIGCISSLMAP
jgi:hypothetical protein